MTVELSSGKVTGNRETLKNLRDRLLLLHIYAERQGYEATAKRAYKDYRAVREAVRQ